MELIEQATIFIGVLTALEFRRENEDLRLYNPNVLWELGYAQAIRKPVVILADSKSVKTIPVLAGEANICLYNHQLVREVNALEAQKTLFLIAQDLAPYVEKAYEDARSGNVIGVRTRAIVHSTRGEIDIADMISTADCNVDILTTNVDYFVREKFNTISAPEKNPFTLALKRGASIRIVTMDPECVIAEYRAKQLGRGDDIPAYREELRNGIILLNKLFQSNENFRLHLYNDLPLQITMRIDRNVITSIVTRGERSRKRIQIQFSLYDPGVSESFVSHFQSVFDNAKDVKGIPWVIRRSCL